MPDIKEALRDFVATSNSGKYTDEKTLLSKFPELKGYDVNALRDFVATSNSGKYKSEDELFSKFPEFNPAPPPTTEPTSQPRNKVAEMLNQPTSQDIQREKRGISEVPKEVPSGTKTPQIGVKEETIRQDVEATQKQIKDRERWRENKVIESAYIGTKQEAKAKGYKNTLEMFPEKSDNIANYLNEESKVEYNFLKALETYGREVDELTARTEATGNPQTQADLQKAKFNKYKAQVELEKFTKQRNTKIDEQINFLSNTVQQLQQEGDREEEIAGLQKDIVKLQSEKENYLQNPDQKIMSVFSANKQEMDEFKVPGNTPRERVKNYALIVNRQIEEIDEKIKTKFPGEPLEEPSFTGGYDAATRSPELEDLWRRKMELIPKMQALAQVALVDRLPQKDTGGFFGAMTDQLKKELLRDKFTQRNLEDMDIQDVGNLIEQNQIAMGLSDEMVKQSALKRTADYQKPTEFFSSEGIGGLFGTSLSLAMPFGIAGKVTKVAKLPKAIQAISTAAQATKYGKHLVPIIKASEQGIKYAAAEPFIKQEELKDEANFLSGFLGAMLSKPVEKALSATNIQAMISKMFGDKAPIVVNQITKFGNRLANSFGEYSSEVGESIGSIVKTYTETKDFAELKKSLNDQFGSLEPNMELFVGSVVMGFFMGSGTGIGDAAINKSKEVYAAMTPEQKKTADEILKQFKDDLETSEVNAKRQEIAEGETAPKVEEVTEVDLQNKQAAIEVIQSPTTSIKEKAEAAKIVRDVDAKQREVEITEKALEKGPLEEGEVVKEEVVETPKEEVVSETPMAEELADVGNEFKIDDKNVFYHASNSKRIGRLKPSTAQQFGTGVYFSTNKELVKNEFGEEVTEAKLAIEKPVYTNTKEWYKVEELALKKANEGKKVDEEGFIIGEEKDIAEIKPKFISDAAKELGYDAIIDKGSSQYENEIIVLDESKIKYPEDLEPTPTSPTTQETPILKEEAKIDNKIEETPQKVEEGVDLLKDVENTAKVLKDINIGVDVKKSKNQTNSLGQNIEEGNVRYDIKSDDKKTLGSVVLKDLKDKYEVVSSKVDEPNKGIGTKAYKKMILTFDKPIVSDMARTSQAEALWKKLTNQGFAKLSEDGLVYESVNIPQAYQKAKADGTNPELVKAVEELLTTQSQNKQIETTLSEQKTSKQAKKEGLTPLKEQKPKAKAQPKTEKPKPFVSKSGKQVVGMDDNGEMEVYDKATGKVASAPTRRKALKEYIESTDFNKGERSVDPPEEFREKNYTPEVIDEFVVDNTNNPLEVVEVFLRQEPVANRPSSAFAGGSKTDIIANAVDFPKIKRSGFKRFGDKNLINASMAKSYFSNEGIPIDVVAQSISDETGVEITTDDLVEFMVNFPNGQETALRMGDNKAAKAAKDKFKELTGLNLTKDIAKQIVSQQSKISKQQEEQFLQEEYERIEQLRDEYWATYEESVVNGTEDGGTIKTEQPITSAEGKGVSSVESETKADTEQALKDTIAKELNKSANELGVFNIGSTKLWLSMAKLMGLYSKKGVTKFGDFIKATGYKATSVLKDLWDGITRKKTTPISKSVRNSKLKTLNARVLFYEALIGVDPLADGQTQLDALKDTIATYKTLAIHANKSEVQDVINAVDALSDLYIELSADLNTVKDKIASQAANGQQAIELKEDLTTVGKLIESFADDFKWQEKVQNEIEKVKGALPDDMNPYMQKDISIGRVENTISEMTQKLFGKRYGELKTNKKGDKALFERAAKDKISQEDLDFFMYVQHAKERNARVEALTAMQKAEAIDDAQKRLDNLAKKDQNDPDVKSKTKAAQQALSEAQSMPIVTDGSGMTNEEADRFMQEFKKSGKVPKLEEYAKEYRETVIKPMIDMMEEGNLLDADQAEMFRTGMDKKTGVKWEYYVPLKVEKEALEQSQGTVASASPTLLNPIKSIKGTSKYDYVKRVSPIAQSISDFQAAAKATENNKVAQSLYKLVQENPNKKVWEIVSPTFMPNADGIPMNQTAQDVKDNSIPVKINGKLKYIKLNHKGLREAWMRKQSSPAYIYRLILNVFRTYNNFKRKVLTQFSPEFALVNLIRDVQDAVFNSSGVDMPFLGKQIVGNLPKANATAAKAIYGNLDPDSNMGKMLDLYLANGGKISWANYDTIEDVQKEIDQLTAKFSENKSLGYYGKNGFNKIVATIGAFNETVETGTRLATFKALVDNGITPEKAAAISKNMTVNFNKRGTATPLLNAAYLFSNAGIQSIYVGAKGLIKSKKTQRYAAYMMLTGAAIPFIQQMMIAAVSESDEEEKEYKQLLTDEDNTNYIVIPTGNKEFLRIPKSYGMIKVFLNSGQEIGSAMIDGEIAEHTGNIVSTLLSVIDPITGSSQNKLSAVAPTTLRPFVEVLFLNKNFQNAPIYPEDRFGPESADYLKFYPKTADFYKNFAENMYFRSGSNIDVSPETLEYIVNDFFSGVFRTGENFIVTGTQLAQGKEVDPNKIPFKSKFIVDMSEQDWRYTKDFWNLYNNSEKVIYTEDEIKETIDLVKKLDAKRAKDGGPKAVKDFGEKIKTIKKGQQKLKEQKEAFEKKQAN